MGQVAVSVRLLGTPQVDTESGALQLSPAATTLLAYLALGPREGRGRSLVASHLFGDCPEPVGRRRLNTALWRLRSQMREEIGVDPVHVRDTRWLGLSADMDLTVDATDFARMVCPVLDRPAESITAADAAVLEQAITMRRGALMEPCADDWVLAERARLENLYLASLDHLIQFHGSTGDAAAVARCAEAAFAAEPLREDVHRHAMRAYATAGRPDLAEAQFERCRLVLATELGADPMPETLALRASLRGASVVDITHSTTLAGLVAELERARRDVERIGAAVDRALAHLQGR